VLDNVLKPLLLGRGVNVPMVIIFVGAIGGFLTSGIIGLFVGAVVLALGYKLFVAWLTEQPQPAPQESKPDDLTVGSTSDDNDRTSTP
jgi:predicted PurR-regulated permease PerM